MSPFAMLFKLAVLLARGALLFAAFLVLPALFLFRGHR